MARSADQIFRQAGRGDHVVGWKLDPEERAQLAEQFAPRFGNLIADHVTLAVRVARGSPRPEETNGAIVGRADDGSGVEAMIVAIGGTTERPDGGVYHVTWSLADGRKAKESNAMLQTRSWTMFEAPIPIRLEPATFR